ncbi:MAG: transposase [Planctomycetes bacterium RIFCSPHIGHO2_02_FULL_38_41]|nr:MAG: transposase [Planctomycetes bacterium RIFCSPHIGHO2_02_FULL_38_41]OHB98087.1 MAG: transposase [Planctomycetes bacterium RIFCSPLOWO2_12_38_17]
MRSRYQVIKNSGVYFITSTIIEWIPVFTKREYFDIVVQSLSYCRQSKSLKLFAYVVMDNHVHLIASSDKLSQIIRDFKSYTAREIIKTAKLDERKWLLNQFEYYKKKYKKDSEYQVWQEGFHPQMIMEEEVFRQKVEYIHHNPVKRGFVDQAEHWVYSSARNYSIGEGCIEIDLIEI